MHSKQLLGSTGFNNSLFWRGQRHWAVYPEIPMNHLTRAFVNWSSWWFQTFEKYKSKWESSPNRSENKKYLKPPTSGVFLHCFLGHVTWWRSKSLSANSNWSTMASTEGVVASRAWRKSVPRYHAGDVPWVTPKSYMFRGFYGKYPWFLVSKTFIVHGFWSSWFFYIYPGSWKTIY